MHLNQALLVITIIINIMLLQLMKPVYQNFIEKSVQQMAVQAAEMAVHNTTALANGKPKQS